MRRKWRFLIQEQVQADRFIPVPSEVRDAVMIDHQVHGPSMNWNIHQNREYIILSQGRLTKDKYISIDRYNVYGVKEPDQRARVRLPQKVHENISANIVSGERIVFLAFEEMLAGETTSVYLLPTNTVLQLLKSDGSPDASSGQTGPPDDIVSDVPGFFD